MLKHNTRSIMGEIEQTTINGLIRVLFHASSKYYLSCTLFTNAKVLGPRDETVNN